MPIELVPTPLPAVAVAVRRAVRSARIEPELVQLGYASPWRRAGLEAGVRRGDTGDTGDRKGRPYGPAPSPRKARGAIRA